MHTEGDRLLVEKVKLSTTKYPSNVSIAKLQSALEAMVYELKKIKMRVLEIQTGMHSNIELCRGRYHKHSKDVEMRQARLDLFAAQISMAEMEMDDAEEQCKGLIASVQDLDVRVADAERLANEKKTAGICSAVAGGVGLALAPLVCMWSSSSGKHGCI